MSLIKHTSNKWNQIEILSLPIMDIRMQLVKSGDPYDIVIEFNIIIYKSF